MSTRTITFKTCNGCNRDTLFDNIIIIKSQSYFAIPMPTSNPTIDLCDLCDREGKYICRHCRQVHDDDHPCPRVKELMEQAEIITASINSDVCIPF